MDITEKLRKVSYTEYGGEVDRYTVDNSFRVTYLGREVRQIEIDGNGGVMGLEIEDDSTSAFVIGHPRDLQFYKLSRIFVD